jgi:hypothetical protein
MTSPTDTPSNPVKTVLIVIGDICVLRAIVIDTAPAITT